MKAATAEVLPSERSLKSLTRGNIPEIDDSVTDVAMVPQVHGHVQKIKGARKFQAHRKSSNSSRTQPPVTTSPATPSLEGRLLLCASPAPNNCPKLRSCCAFHLHPPVQSSLPLPSPSFSRTFPWTQTADQTSQPQPGRGGQDQHTTSCKFVEVSLAAPCAKAWSPRTCEAPHCR